MKDKYRIPDISEFIQGFEFQYSFKPLTSYALYCPDTDEYIKLDDEKKEEKFNDYMVNWKHKSDEIITVDYGELTVKYKLPSVCKLVCQLPAPWKYLSTKICLRSVTDVLTLNSIVKSSVPNLKLSFDLTFK